MKGRLALGLALGAFFLYLSLRKVDLAQSWEIIRQVRYPYLIGFVAVNLLGLWLRAVRWGYLLRPVAAVRAHRLLSPMCIGLMANFPFPGRVGEFVRAYLVGKKERVSKSAAFATVVVERLFDGLAIISFLSLAPFFLRSEQGKMVEFFKWAGLGIFLVYVVIFIVLLLMSHHREALARFLLNSGPVRRWRPLRRLSEMIQKFTDGLAILRSPGQVLGALALSFVVWGLSALLNFMMMESVGMDLPPYAPFFLVVVQMFGVMIPSPGFVGPYQFAHIEGLKIYGVAESDAFGLAILIHAGYFAVFVGAGLFFFLREHLSWGELEEVAEREGRLEK